MLNSSTWSTSALLWVCFFFFSSRRRHTRSDRDWSSDVCSSDLRSVPAHEQLVRQVAGRQRPHGELDVLRAVLDQQDLDFVGLVHGAESKLARALSRCRGFPAPCGPASWT